MLKGLGFVNMDNSSFSNLVTKFNDVILGLIFFKSMYDKHIIYSQNWTLLNNFNVVANELFLNPIFFVT